MPEVEHSEHLEPEDFAEVKDARQLEQLIKLEEAEAMEHPDPGHEEALKAMRERLEQIRLSKQS